MLRTVLQGFILEERLEWEVECAICDRKESKLFPPTLHTLARPESTLSDAEVLLNQNGNGVNPATSLRHKKENRPSLALPPAYVVCSGKISLTSFRRNTNCNCIFEPWNNIQRREGEPNKAQECHEYVKRKRAARY